MKNIRLTDFASQCRCSIFVQSHPHQPSHQIHPPLNSTKHTHISVIYSKMMFADAEPCDNPSKYVMQPDPQTGAWPQPADVSPPGKYFESLLLSCTHTHTHLYTPVKHWLKLSLCPPSCVSVSLLITLLGSRSVSEYTSRLSDLHLQRELFVPGSYFFLYHTKTHTHSGSSLLDFQVASPHCLHVERELPLLCCPSGKICRPLTSESSNNLHVEKPHAVNCASTCYQSKHDQIWDGALQWITIFVSVVMRRIYVYYSTECLSVKGIFISYSIIYGAVNWVCVRWKQCFILPGYHLT